MRSVSDAGELDRGIYDKATQDVLDVEFPTWYYSTHGLSRPSTPVEEDKQRSVANKHMHISKGSYSQKYKYEENQTDFLRHC